MIRKASQNEIEGIFSILLQAKRFLKSQGIPQWQNEKYPSKVDIEEDIKYNTGRVYLFEGQVISYASLETIEDPNYKSIFDGKWLNNNTNYATIHRLAIKNQLRGKGLSHLFLQELIQEAKQNGYSDIRIDTHEQNTIMQHLIEKSNFKYCGKVIVEDGSERLAYQLLL